MKQESEYVASGNATTTTSENPVSCPTKRSTNISTGKHLRYYQVTILTYIMSLECSIMTENIVPCNIVMITCR